MLMQHMKPDPGAAGGPLPAAAALPQPLVIVFHHDPLMKGAKSRVVKHDADGNPWSFTTTVGTLRRTLYNFARDELLRVPASVALLDIQAKMPGRGRAAQEWVFLEDDDEPLRAAWWVSDVRHGRLELTVAPTKLLPVLPLAERNLLKVPGRRYPYSNWADVNVDGAEAPVTRAEGTTAAEADVATKNLANMYIAHIATELRAIAPARFPQLMLLEAHYMAWAKHLYTVTSSTGAPLDMAGVELPDWHAIGVLPPLPIRPSPTATLSSNDSAASTPRGAPHMRRKVRVRQPHVLPARLTAVSASTHCCRRQRQLLHLPLESGAASTPRRRLPRRLAPPRTAPCRQTRPAASCLRRPSRARPPRLHQARTRSVRAHRGGAYVWYAVNAGFAQQRMLKKGRHARAPLPVTGRSCLRLSGASSSSSSGSRRCIGSYGASASARAVAASSESGHGM